MDALTLEIKSNAGDATSGISSLAKALGELKDIISNLDMSKIAKSMGAVSKASKSATDAVQKVTNKYSFANKAVKKSEIIMNGYDNASRIVHKNGEGVRTASWNPSRVMAENRAATRAIEQAMQNGGRIHTKQDDVFARNLDKYFPRQQNKYTPSGTDITGVGNELDKASEGYKHFGEEAQNAAKETEKATSRITKSAHKTHRGLTSMIGRMILRRAIYSAIRAITGAAKEGFNNVYQYSKKMGGSFASAMDSAKSSVFTMKNAIGTALAPAVQALLPILQTVVSWIRTACNALSQFFALLNGSGSWTRATDYATEFADAASGAGGAASDWLADWDELNVMNHGGGGGGGGAATDYENMFEEVYTFDGWIKDSIDWIEKHAQNIKDILAGAVAFLATLSLTKSIALSLTVGSVVLSYENGYTMGYKTQSGEEVSDFEKWIAGISIVGGAIGGASVGGKIAGWKGVVVGGAIGLILSVGALTIGFEKGKKIAFQDGFWGEIELTEEEVSRYVSSLFTIDVDTKIKVIGATLSNAAEARQKVSEALYPLQNTLRLVKLGVATTPDELKKQVNDLITAFNAQLSADIDVLKTALTIVDIKNVDGTSALTNGIALTEELSAAVTGIGKEISEKIAEGIELGQGTILDALNETLASVVEAYEIGRLTGDFHAGVAGLDRGSVNKILEGYSGLYSETESSVREVVQESISVLYGDAAGFAELAKKYGDPESEMYDAKLAEDYAKKSAEALAEAKRIEAEFETIVADYMVTITSGSKEDLIELIKSNADWNALLLTLGTGTGFADTVEGMKNGGTGAIVENFDKGTMNHVADTLGIDSSLMETLGIDVIDLLGAERYIALFMQALDAAGYDMDAKTTAGALTREQIPTLMSLWHGEEFGKMVEDWFSDRDERRTKAEAEKNRRLNDSIMPLENELFWDSVSSGTNTSPNVILDWLLSNGVTDVQDISKEAWDEAYEVINEMLSNGMWGDAEEERLLDIFGDNGYFGKILQMVQEMFDYGFTGFPEFGNGSGWYFGKNNLIPAGAGLVGWAGMSDVGRGGFKPDDIPPATVHSLATATTADVVEGINASMNNGTLASGFASVLENALVSVRSKMDTANAHLSNIERKNMVVNVGATSGLGRVSSTGQELYNRVSGRV